MTRPGRRRRSRSAAGFLAVMLIFGDGRPSGSEGGDPDLLRSNRLGLERLRAAAAAHGSLTSDALRLFLDISCRDYRNPTQARIPDPPVESYSWTRRYRIDRPRRIESVRTRNGFAGFVFDDEIEVREGRAVRLDHNLRTREAASGTGIELSPLLPQRHLAAGLANPLSVRSRSEAPGGAWEIDLVDGGTTHRLRVDPRTRLLLRAEVLRHADPYGHTLRTYEFEDPEAAGGIALPRRIRVSTLDAVLGQTVNVFTFDRLARDPGAESTPSLPYVDADHAQRPPASVRRLADRIHLAENVTSSTGQWSYNVLFAEFDDHVLVAEAPLDEATTEGVLRRIGETVPGKPVRYLVQSHHHDDHLGGIRAYIARGVRLVLAPGHVPLVNRIAAAPYVARPDALARQPQAPELEVVRSGRLVLSDASLEARVYDVGPLSHAQEMLVVHFPRQGVLFQSDLVNAGEFPLGEDGARLRDRIRALGLDVRVLAGAHGRVLSGDALRALGF